MLRINLGGGVGLRLRLRLGLSLVVEIIIIAFIGARGVHLMEEERKQRTGTWPTN